MVTLQLIAAYLPSILQMRQHKRHLAEIVWNCSLKVEWEVRRRLLLVLGGLLPGGVLQKLGVDLVLRELYVSARGIWSNYELWNVYDIINSLNSLGRQVVNKVLYFFLESSPCLLGQHGSCSTAQLPGELSEHILQNLRNKLAPQTVCPSPNHSSRILN